MKPWHPMSSPVDLKHLGKLVEELNECSAAAARCIIQGIDEAEPVTGKVNREWLEEEIADVIANVGLVIEHFNLDTIKIEARSTTKAARSRAWHKEA